MRVATGPTTVKVPGDRTVLVRRLWSASTITLAFALLLMLSLLTTAPASTPSTERVGDESFLAAASETCARANRTVLEPYRSGRVDDPDGLASALEDFVDELRLIDVSTADRPKVDRWIGAWDDLIRTGHAHAAARAAGETRRADELNTQNVITATRINQFAYANGLGACSL